MQQLVFRLHLYKRWQSAIGLPTEEEEEFCDSLTLMEEKRPPLVRFDAWVPWRCSAPLLHALLERKDIVLIKSLIKHYRFKHENHPNFRVPCSVTACAKLFRSTRGLMSHYIQKKHREFHNLHHLTRNLLNQNVENEVHAHGLFGDQNQDHVELDDDVNLTMM